MHTYIIANVQTLLEELHNKGCALCAAVYLEVSERDVPVSRRVRVGAGHEQGVVFVQAADVLAMVGGSGGSVDLAGIECSLLGPVVVDVDAV